MVKRSARSAAGQSVTFQIPAPAHAVMLPKPFLYRNNGSKGQFLCKICDAGFSPDESRFSSVKLRCPHCGNTLVPKKDRKHFIVHKCVNPECPYYLQQPRKKLTRQISQRIMVKIKYKLHYIYREFTMDFFSMGLNTLPQKCLFP